MCNPEELPTDFDIIFSRFDLSRLQTNDVKRKTRENIRKTVERIMIDVNSLSGFRQQEESRIFYFYLDCVWHLVH